MRRYYISPVIGSGQKSDPYRAKLADYGQPYVTIIPSNPDGTPVFSWCVCLVNSNVHTAILADNSIRALPDVSLDIRFNAISNQGVNAIRNALSAFNLDDISTGVKNNGAFRDVLREIGQRLDAAFDENNFDTA